MQGRSDNVSVTYRITYQKLLKTQRSVSVAETTLQITLQEVEKTLQITLQKPNVQLTLQNNVAETPRTLQKKPLFLSF